jgi:hypothetical protein
MPNGLFAVASSVKLSSSPKVISWRDLTNEEGTRIVQLNDDPPRSKNSLVESCLVPR